MVSRKILVVIRQKPERMLVGRVTEDRGRDEINGAQNSALTFLLAVRRHDSVLRLRLEIEKQCYTPFYFNQFQPSMDCNYTTFPSQVHFFFVSNPSLHFLALVCSFSQNTQRSYSKDGGGTAIPRELSWIYTFVM